MELPVLTIDQLRNAVQGERIDTVVLALTDPQDKRPGLNRELDNARVELDAFESFVTDWERERL